MPRASLEIDRCFGSFEVSCAATEELLAEWWEKTRGYFDNPNFSIRYLIWSRFIPRRPAALVWFHLVRSSACTSRSRSSCSRFVPPVWWELDVLGGSGYRAEHREEIEGQDLCLRKKDGAFDGVTSQRARESCGTDRRPGWVSRL